MNRMLAILIGTLLLFVSGVATADPDPGYLFPGADLHIQTWLPPAPPRDSLAQAADVQAIFSLRADLDGPRGGEAHRDDVFVPADVAPRFDFILGIHLDAKSAPATMRLLQLASNDAEWLMRPVKRRVADGGRPRPLVDYPALHTCEITYKTLPESGSYPSGHGSLGWIWGNLLAELAPEHADALIARGIAFGDSRVVCGFHYPSDIVAGRMAAAVLLERLHADKRFLRDLDNARAEIARLQRRR
jgi:acid phosphatase (class A)